MTTGAMLLKQLSPISLGDSGPEQQSRHRGQQRCTQAAPTGGQISHLGHGKGETSLQTQRAR
jgi:hypothetical protein